MFDKIPIEFEQTLNGNESLSFDKNHKQPTERQFNFHVNYAFANEKKTKKNSCARMTLKTNIDMYACLSILNHYNMWFVSFPLTPFPSIRSKWCGGA